LNKLTTTKIGSRKALNSSLWLSANL